ncbi:MAG: response regulator [Patescibacteria group bacterium]|jgi:CheY-like chemotaxis protein
MGGSKRILVVDDNADNRETIMMFLEMEDYEISCARDGRNALDVLNNQGHFDLVITDYHMPIACGDVVKRYCDSANIPCIVMSSAREELAENYEYFWGKTEIPILVDLVHSIFSKL